MVLGTVGTALAAVLGSGAAAVGLVLLFETRGPAVEPPAPVAFARAAGAVLAMVGVSTVAVAARGLTGSLRGAAGPLLIGLVAVGALGLVVAARLTAPEEA